MYFTSFRGVSIDIIGNMSTEMLWAGNKIMHLNKFDGVISYRRLMIRVPRKYSAQVDQCIRYMLSTAQKCSRKSEAQLLFSMFNSVKFTQVELSLLLHKFCWEFCGRMPLSSMKTNCNKSQPIASDVHGVELHISTKHNRSHTVYTRHTIDLLFTIAAMTIATGKPLICQIVHLAEICE